MIIGRIIAVLIGYCFGMILMGYFIGKSKHIDLTKVGSGNVGSTNTMRNLGVPAGLITLLWDCFKCVVACFVVWLTYHRFFDDVSIYMVYAGLGTEFRFWFSSIDLEFIQKLVICPSLYPKNREELRDFNFTEYTIPSFRFTWNIISGNVVDLGVGASFDLYIQNKNEQAFALTSHKNGIKGDNTILYPSYFFGFKIK